MARLKLLGYQILAAGIKPLSEYIEAVRNFQRPENAKSPRSFLGMINYYRMCILNATSRQKTLHGELSHIKGKPEITQTQELDHTFQSCKDNLAEASSYGGAELELFIDAS